MGLVKASGSTSTAIKQTSKQKTHYIRNTQVTCVSERNEFIQGGDAEYSLWLLLIIIECIKEYQENNAIAISC